MFTDVAQAKRKMYKYTTLPATLAIASLALSSTAHATGSETINIAQPVDTQQQEVEDLELDVSEDEFEEAVDYALENISDPIDDPEGYEQAIQDYLDEESGEAGADPQALPIAVIWASRLAGCVAGAYPTIQAIDPNQSQEHIYMMLASAVFSCVGGGGTAEGLARWMSQNPRTVAIALNAVGLGSLTGDSAETTSSSTETRQHSLLVTT